MTITRTRVETSLPDLDDGDSVLVEYQDMDSDQQHQLDGRVAQTYGVDDPVITSAVVAASAGRFRIQMGGSVARLTDDPNSFHVQVGTGATIYRYRVAADGGDHDPRNGHGTTTLVDCAECGRTYDEFISQRCPECKSREIVGGAADARADGGDPDYYRATASRGSSGETTLHADRDCPRLSGATSVVPATSSEQAWGEVSTCDHCTGDGPSGYTGDDPMARRNALLDADPDDLATDGGRVTTDGRPAFLPPEVDTVTCYVCGDRIPAEDADGIDVSREQDLYPDLKPVCPNHGGAGS